jgi:hypothetical protein
MGVTKWPCIDHSVIFSVFLFDIKILVRCKMTKLATWRCFSVVMAVVLISGVAAAITAGFVRAQQGNWTIQTVDELNVHSTSLALDSQGNPHIAYTAVEGLDHNSLYYASWTGTDWVKELVDDVPARVCSLALDSQDHPHIGYTTSVSDSLRYAQKPGTIWVKETVDPRLVADCSLALDSQGRPHISYIAPMEADPLRYAWWTGTAWAFDIVDPREEIPASCSLALDSHDSPHIGYATVEFTSVHYLHLIGSSWLDEVVDAGPAIAVSIALDSQDNPHLSYATGELRSLHYASRAGAAWTKETVDPAPVTDCSLRMDSQDRPHISYFVNLSPFAGIGQLNNLDDGTLFPIGGMLKYASLTDSVWNIEIVDQEHGAVTATLLTAPTALLIASKWSSLALDRCDSPHISYGNLISAVPASLHYAFIPCIKAPITPKMPRRPTSLPSVNRNLNPANMSVQFVSINPQQTSANQPVTVTANVLNTGDLAGNYNVALTINGQVEATRTISVGPQASQPVKFTVTRDQPGTYTVNIVDKSGSFTILGNNAAGSASGKNSAVLVILAIFAVLAVAAVVVLLTRRS